MCEESSPIIRPGGTAPSADLATRWFGAEKLRSRLKTVEAFWSGQGRHLVSITTGKHGYRQLRDAAAILKSIGPNLKAQAEVPGVNLPSLFPDYGTISLPRYWGGTVHWPEGTCPYIDPVAGDVEAALRITPARVDDPRQDAARALTLFESARAGVGGDALWMRSIDMQGPLNVAAMVVDQEELMMAMYESPSRVERLLERVTGFMIELVDHLIDSTRGRICGNIWPYTFLPISRGLSFTEDIMPLVSDQLYRRFALPYLRRLSDHYGGLLIHCCGHWGRHAATLGDETLNVIGAEFHYPFTRIEELDALAGRAVLIPYLALDNQHDFASTADYYRHLLDRFGHRHRFWFAWPDDTEEARGFLESVGECG
ncbi:MAG: hypothetical protein JJU36_04340 [Phycisphaeraceae bacterium]|nr:hypothetical protein [Phycisphaeraceae bacterium]